MSKLNLANRLTFLRIIMVPVFVAFLMFCGIPNNYLWALLTFCLASVTDFIDGQVARRMNMITDLGKFLDPLADKILVVAAMICFVELKLTYSWVVIIIIAREFMVSGVRMLAAGRKEKIVIAADISGKIKTAFTMLAIVAVLLMLSLLQMGVFANVPVNYLGYISTYNNTEIIDRTRMVPEIADYLIAIKNIHVITDILMCISAALTVWSGVSYMWKFRAVFKDEV